MKEPIMIIDDEKEITLFINTLNKVNQIMKKYSFEEQSSEDNLNVGYTIFDFEFESYLFKENCIPREIYIQDIYFNKKQQEIIDSWKEQLDDEYLNMFVSDSKELFNIIKEYKKLITSIEIYKSKVVLKTKHDSWEFKRNVEIEGDSIKLTDESVEILLNKDNQPDVLEEFLNTTGVYTLYFDTEELKVYLNKDDFEYNENIIKLIISHKYITGLSGCKVDKMDLTIKITCIEGTDDINQFDFIINNNDKITITNSFVGILI